jgi:hypothetical protein
MDGHQHNAAAILLPHFAWPVIATKFLAAQKINLMTFKESICVAVVGCSLLTIFPVPAGELPRVFANSDRIRYDSQCLTIDGKDVFIFSGAFHYFRCPKPLWPDRFQKIKAAGFNCVETYVPWNWHERNRPAGLKDYSQVNLTDLEDFLKLAESFGLYVIIRPGPYICAEWDTGGFPQWLMTEKPAQPLRKEIWLRTDDPVYLDWCRHWYDAVCPVIARHQITRKPPGQPGVILFQIENEYDFVKPKLSEDIMRNQLRALAGCARTNGIDVPLFTCLTHAVRGAEDPLLRQVFDACNFYPLWKVDGIQEKIDLLRREQPDAPLATAELQGGWFAKVGGKLSEEQDGLSAAQINNLTLFVIQNGETILNYYMLFGGTNPGDWAARGMISSYDYTAPIRECGGVDDRYQRVWAIGQMLREHGSRLARAVAVDVEADTAQKDVTVVARRAADGGLYFFVRTSQHVEPRAGEAVVKETNAGGPAIKFAYELEPFGSKILYLPTGVSNAAQGEWLPRTAPNIARPANLPPAMAIAIARYQNDPGPSHWTKLQRCEDLARAGIYDSRFLFYQTKGSCPSGMRLIFEYPSSDAILANIDGKPAARIEGNGARSVFKLPAGKSAVRLLYENCGHDNGYVKMENPRGILSAGLLPLLPATDDAKTNFTSFPTNETEVLPKAEPQSLSFGEPRGAEQEWWRPGFNDARWPQVSIGTNQPTTNTAQLTWYRMRFVLPAPVAGIWIPWQLHLDARGNGFLYLNGHNIGRYWQAGPQHDFFLPECWLNFGPGKSNNLTLSLRPLDHGVAIRSAVIEPHARLAEFR